MWMVSGILSVAFTVLGWVFAARRNQKAAWASLCAVSFMAITLLLEYRLVSDWVNKEDWAALMDVVPSMFGILAGYVVVVLLANVGAAAWSAFAGEKAQ